MALCDSPLVDFNKNVNRQTKVYLSVEDAILSPTYPTAEPGVNKLRLTLKDEYRYRGTGIVTYNRLNLADLETMLPVKPNIDPAAQRLYHVLDEVTQGLGILLTVADVYDSGLVYDPVRGWNMELKARPESYRWYGIYRLYFENLPALSTTLTRLNLLW
jgi:hypothetical protein